MLIMAPLLFTEETTRASENGCVSCESCLKGSCFESAASSCDCTCRNGGSSNNSCRTCGLRDRKKLLHWPGGEVSYITGDEPEEPLVTDRPDFTEATPTVGLGRSQVEFGYTYIRDENGGERFSGHSYPELLYRVGIAAEWLEFRVGWNYASERVTVGGVGDTVDGAEDLYLGFKVALTEQDGWLPETAIMPQMTVPTGARAFTSDEVMPGINFLYSWELNDFLSIGGSTQGNRAFDGATDFYEEYAQSVTIGYSLTEKLGAFTECYGIFPHHAETAFTEYYFDTGLTYKFSDNVQVDWRAGWGLNEQSDDFFTGVGGAVRF